MRNIKAFTLIIALVVLITGCSTQDKNIQGNAANHNVINKSIDSGKEYWPGDQWRASTPEELGVDSEKLYDLVKGIKDNKTEIDSLIIVRNGYMITEAYFSPEKDTTRELNSATKSITSAVFGKAINDGIIKSKDMKLLDIYPDVKISNRSILKEQITLKHLLTMTAGFEWNEWGSSYNDVNNPSIQLGRCAETVQFMLDQPVTSESGKTFNYNSGESHLLSAVFTKLSGKTMSEYADEKLFKPLGITKKSWARSPDGVSYGGYGLSLTAKDMAKIGYLFLRKGNWNNQQIISPEWVEESTKSHIDADLYGTTKGYGYQWWINSFGGYSARGLHGQYIIVMPDLDMVVVFQSHFTNNDLIPLYYMERNIIPAVKSSQPLPPNPKKAKLLKSISNGS